MQAHFFTVLIALLAIASVTQSRSRYAPQLRRWIEKKGPATYEDAAAICARRYGILASPLTVELFNYMQSFNMKAFIGISKDSSKGDQEAQYITVEGKRLNDLPKAVSDAIQRLDGTQGDCLSMDKNGIHVVSCDTELPFICYTNETIDCGYGCIYSNVTGSTYKFYGAQMMTWERATTTCAELGSYLAVVNDAAEATVLREIMGWVRYLGPWVGLRDRGAGGVSDWRSVRGEPLEQIYHEWNSNRKNDPKYGCAILYRNKLLDAYDCENTRYFICETSE